MDIGSPGSVNDINILDYSNIVYDILRGDLLPDVCALLNCMSLVSATKMWWDNHKLGDVNEELLGCAEYKAKNALPQHTMNYANMTRNR